MTRSLAVVRRLALWLSLALATSCIAADYYVHAALGSDANAGSAAYPWRTLSRLAQTMASGDRAFLAGEFRERLYLAGLSNITVAQWPGAVVIVPGFKNQMRVVNRQWPARRDYHRQVDLHPPWHLRVFRRLRPFDLCR